MTGSEHNPLADAYRRGALAALEAVEALADRFEDSSLLQRVTREIRRRAYALQETPSEAPPAAPAPRRKRAKAPAPRQPGLAVGYVRVSTEGQAREGLSLAQQQVEIEQYCTFRGFELVSVLSDPGVSASTPLDRRPEGAQLGELLRTSGVSCLVTCKLDRLFRSAEDCLTMTKAWDDLGVALHLLNLGGQTIDTSTAMGRFFLTVMAGAAEMELNLIRERTRDVMSAKKARGEQVGGLPLGYQLGPDGVHLEPCPVEVQAIQQAKRLRSAGLTLRTIAARLTVDGYTWPRGKLTPATIKRMVAATIEKDETT